MVHADIRPSTAQHGTLVLTRGDVADLLTMQECIVAVEQAFVMHARGLTDAVGILGARVRHGGFHVKTAGLAPDRALFAAKINANFPANRERYALPTIQGVVALFDADNGRLLALLDSIEITSLRTAAATAVAAKSLARADAAVVTICGCGAQGRSQLRALSHVRAITLAYAFDADAARAARYADDMSAALGFEVRPIADLGEGTRASDICVTCTTARQFVLGSRHVTPGVFIAAVGADNPDKQEIEPALLAASTVVVDVLDQCAAIGDLHHAIACGLMRREDVYSELAPIVARTLAGRRSATEVIVFDSTGTALQDVAAAAAVYEKAVARGRGLWLDLEGDSALLQL